jgi:hypothetical protein
MWLLKISENHAVQAHRGQTCPGAFADECKEWRKKPEADQMHANFKMHFQHCCEEHARTLARTIFQQQQLLRLSVRQQ